MNEPTNQTRRRWLQFSLRALLLLMLMVGAYFAGFSTARKIDEKAIKDATDSAAEQLERFYESYRRSLRHLYE